MWETGTEEWREPGTSSQVRQVARTKMVSGCMCRGWCPAEERFIGTEKLGQDRLKFSPMKFGLSF